MTWAFVERDSQSYEMEFRLFIEGVEVTDWVQETIGLTLAGTGAMNTLSFTLANPDDIWTLTADNIAGNFRKSRNLYSEEAKLAIYKLKKQREDQAKKVIQASGSKISLTDAGIYGLGPEQPIFHKHDCVRLFLKHPLTRQDWWMAGFTGFIDSHPFSDDYIMGAVPQSIACYDLKGLMKRMRVALNPIQGGSMKPSATDVQAGVGLAKEQLRLAGILGSEAGMFEDLFSAAGLNHALGGKTLQQAMYFLFLGEGGVTGGSVGQGQINVPLFGGTRSTSISENDTVPIQDSTTVSPKEQEILGKLDNVNRQPEPTKAGGFDNQGNYRNEVGAKRYRDSLSTADRAKLDKYQREAQALGRAYEDAQTRRKQATRRRKAGKSRVRPKTSDPRFHLSTFANRKGHVGRMIKGKIYRYPGNDLEKWHNLTLLGEENGTYLTYDQVTTLGRGTVLDPVRGSPFNARLHMLLPSEGVAANNFVQVDYNINDFSQGVSFETRFDLVNHVCDQLDFQWWVTPFGDVAVEFPMFDFNPKAFKAYQNAMTVDRHAMNASIEDEASDIPTTMVVTAQENSNLAQDAAQAPAQSFDQNRIVVYSPLLAARLGAVVEQISSPVSVGGALSGGQKGIDRAEYWALLQLQKRLGQSSTVSMPTPFRPWLTPNRPLYHKQRERMGVIASVQHSITVNGSCQTTPVLQYIKKLHSDGKFRYMSSQGENMPINYATNFTEAGDTIKSGLIVRRGVLKGTSNAPDPGTQPSSDNRRQVVGKSDDRHRFRYPILYLPKRIPPGYRFGAPRGYRNGIHNGTDFGRLNDTVVAVDDGTVAFAGWLRGHGGVAVYINHSGGWRSIYMHLKENLPVTRGQRVTKKQMIGIVGKTGIKRSPAHVHFELRKGKTPVDPLLWLDREGGNRPVTKPVDQPNQTGRPNFIWPVSSRRPGEPKSYQKFGVRKGRHKGLDFGRRGKPVVASAPGTVRFVGDMKAGGQAVWINHNDGYQTRYLHLLPGSITVRRGDTVTQGQKIAQVGWSGLERAYKPPKDPKAAAHLHFEIRLNGSAQDPEPFLVARSMSEDQQSEEGPKDNPPRRS
jgi:murein DD-endopeptidase MepM/ murein hydrolase activator NlpD